MSHAIYLVVYHSPLFPAHWSTWIPSTANSRVGKVIHVTGDALEGFEHQFKRNYDLVGTGRSHSLVLLASTGDDVITDVPGDGSYREDTEPVDLLEKKALSIPAPGKSLTSTVALKSGRVAIKNCQTWLREFVVALVKDGVFPESAILAVDSAPKN